MGKPKNQWLKGKKVDREKYPKMGNIKSWDNCGYMGKHRRIWKKLGKATHCENPNCSKKCLHYEWANISGFYKEEKEDWKMLCCKCHKIFDTKKGFENVRGYYVRKNH